MAPMRRFCVVGSLTLSFLLVARGAAHACSCAGSDEGFVLASNTELPRNAAGFPWFGYLQDAPAGTGPRRPPPRAGFRLERLGAGGAGAGAKPVPFTLVVEDAAFAEKGGQAGDARGLVILRPQAPLVPGARYRVTHAAAGRGKGAARTQVVEYTIAAAALAPAQGPEASPLTLSVGKGTVGPLTVRTVAGNCSSQIVAAQQPVTFELPASARRWKDALLYAVDVPGPRSWRPAPHLCSSVPHGRSWTGVGRELLYARCSGDDHTDRPLPTGSSAIEVTAWLPGTGIAFRGRGTVTLNCP
jgi:hypothetical protein